MRGRDCLLVGARTVAGANERTEDEMASIFRKGDNKKVNLCGAELIHTHLVFTIKILH